MKLYKKPNKYRKMYRRGGYHNPLPGKRGEWNTDPGAW